MKFMKSKAIAVIAAVVTVCAVALTGCQTKLAPADQVVGALYELAVKDNAVPMKDLLEFASEDDVRASLMEDDGNGLVEMFKAEFESVGIEFSDEELKDMTNTLTGLLNKLTYTAEITDSSSKETTVVLKVNGYSSDSLEQIMVDTQTEVMESMDEEAMMALMSATEEEQMAFVQDVVRACMAKLGDMEPSQELTEITVKCEKMKVDVSGKEKISWMPSDIDKFVVDVDNSTFK